MSTTASKHVPVRIEDGRNQASKNYLFAQALLLVFGVTLVVLGFVIIFMRTGVGPSSVMTTGKPPDTTVVTTAGRTALGSDTIDSFLLASGVVLILVSIFYPRISKIGLPGGGSIELTPIVQAKVAAAIGKDLQDPEQISAAYKYATAMLTTQFRGYPGPPSDELIEHAAATAKALVVHPR